MPADPTLPSEEELDKCICGSDLCQECNPPFGRVIRVRKPAAVKGTTAAAATGGEGTE